MMVYMINIDLESANVSGGGPTNCSSALHEVLGRHYDMTVHVLGCAARGSRSVQRPPTRYWDDNNGEGYPLQTMVERIHVLRATHPDAHSRRCRLCGVGPHLPDWD